MNWYAIFVETGYEDQVKDYIDRVKPYIKKNIIFDLLVPKRKLYERKNGIKKIVVKPLFPGYILIHTDNIENLYLAINKSPHIVKFLKNGSYFMKINVNEMVFIMQMIDETGIINISSACYEREKLIILSGPLTGKEEIIKKVDKRKGRVKIKILINEKYAEIDLGIDIKYLGSENKIKGETSMGSKL